VAAQLRRDAAGITDLDDEAARARVHAQVPDADPEDLVLLYDLLGIRDPDVALPNIDPDARRRRLSALINSVSLPAPSQPSTSSRTRTGSTRSASSMFRRLPDRDSADTFPPC